MNVLSTVGLLTQQVRPSEGEHRSESSFDALPCELIDRICDQLDPLSYICMSAVNRAFRDLMGGPAQPKRLAHLEHCSAALTGEQLLVRPGVAGPLRHAKSLHFLGPLDPRMAKRMVKRAPALQHLDLSMGHNSGKTSIEGCLQHLVRLTDLSSLNLSRRILGEEDMMTLTGARGLTHLAISGRHLRPRLGPLSRLPQLASLRVAGECIDGEACRELSSLSALRRLDLSLSRLSPVDLRPLGCLKLTELSLEGSIWDATVEQMPDLRGMTTLRCLRLRNFAASPVWVEQLPTLKMLEQLDLRHTQYDLSGPLPPQLTGLQVSLPSTGCEGLAEAAARVSTLRSLSILGGYFDAHGSRLPALLAIGQLRSLTLTLTDLRDEDEALLRGASHLSSVTLEACGPYFRTERFIPG